MVILQDIGKCMGWDRCLISAVKGLWPDRENQKDAVQGCGIMTRD
jgi:hypothetical protein